MIAEENRAWGDTPYTLQPGGCGEEGDYIHITPNYLKKNSSEDVTHRPGDKYILLK